MFCEVYREQQQRAIIDRSAGVPGSGNPHCDAGPRYSVKRLTCNRDLDVQLTPGCCDYSACSVKCIGIKVYLSEELSRGPAAVPSLLFVVTQVGFLHTC